MNRSEVQEQPNCALKCDICEHGFTQKGDFNVHMRIHLGKAGKKFRCDICGFGAVRKSGLETHMLIHTGEESHKPHRCRRCSERFTHINHLKRHQMTHKKKKLPYHCVGYRRFAQQEEKETHVESCKDRRYECRLCEEYITATKTSMEYHMRCHHSGDKPLRCEVCMKNFREKIDLYRHFNKHSEIGSKNRE